MIHELPMVTESEATGRVRAVYADLRGTFPFVPLVFRALAIQPPVLAMAWEHGRALMGQEAFAERTAELERLALPRYGVPAMRLAHLSPARQEAMAGITAYFARTTPAIALMTASLAMGLAGQFSRPATSGSGFSASRQALPHADLDLVEPDEAPASLRHRFRQLRMFLGLPYVPSLYRVLGGDPVLLDTVWEALSRNLAHCDFQDQEQLLADDVRRLAGEIPPTTVLCKAALTQAGLGDTYPAIQRLVAIFAAGTLRQLVLSQLLAEAATQPLPHP